MTRKFRWSIDGGANWNYEDADLPFNLATVEADQTVIVEPIGAAVTDEGVAPEYMIAAHSRFVGLGDSITSQSSSKGFRNWLLWTVFFLNASLRPSVGADQGKGGDTLAQINARLPYTIGQKPQVVFYMAGHNDGFSSGTTATRIAANRLNLNGLRSGLPDAVLVVSAALPSTVGTENPTVLADYNSDIQAWCNADGNAVYLPVPAGFVAATDTEDGTHPNIRGAKKIGKSAAAILAPLIEPITADELLEQTTAGAEFGANTDTERAFSSTGGIKSGAVLPTGNVVAGKEVTNSTSVAPACDVVSGNQIIDLVGTPASENNVVFDEATGSNVSLASSGQIGKYFEYLVGVEITDTDGVSAPTGLRDFKAALGSLGNFGSISSVGSTMELDEAVSGVLRTWPLVCTVNSTLSVSPDVTLRFPAVPADTRVKLRKPIARQVETTAYALPFFVDGDGIIGSTGTVRITGTASNGQTLTGGPGTPAGGGIAVTFQWKRYNAGTNAFVENIAGATGLTYVLTAGDVGYKIGLTVTATNTFGATSKDSALTATVA